MAEHNDMGEWGEQIARQYLEKNDYGILETNYRHGKDEADIIAYDDGMIVFVEVKTRSNTEFGNPEDFVDRNKQRAYIRLANYYLIENNRPEEARFDIIAISKDDEGTHIRHLRDAFNAVGQHR